MSGFRETAEFARVEEELSGVLRDQYSVQVADLDLPPDEQATFDVRAQATISRILADPRTVTTLPRRRLSWVLTAAAVATAVLGITVWSFDHGTAPAYAATPPILDIAGVNASRYPLAGTNPDKELAALAKLASTNPTVINGRTSGVTMGPGKAADAQHVEVASWWLETTDRTSTVTPLETQHFVMPDGSVRVITQRGRPLDDGIESSPSASPSPNVVAVPAAEGGTLGRPEKLPLDPDELRATLLGDPRECAGREGYCLSNAIQAMGLGHILSPDLNAALLRTMIGADDVRYAGRAIDRTGRPSQVFVVNDPDRKRQRLVLFDADTGAYNGDETVLVKDSEELGVKAPAVIGFNTVVNREWIAAGAAPPVSR